MSYARLVSLEVGDEAGYAAYRAAMTPLLEAAGGSFVVDLAAPTVLKHPADFAPNRVFLLAFASKEDSDAFFASDVYKAIREEHFAPAVNHTHSIAVSTI